MTVDLTELLEQQRWDEAIAYVATAATADNSILDYIHQLRWRTEGPSLQSVQHSLASIKDTLWVVETCLMTVVEELAINEALTMLGLERSSALLEEAETKQTPLASNKADAIRKLQDRKARLATYRSWVGLSEHDASEETADVAEAELEDVAEQAPDASEGDMVELEDPWDDAEIISSPSVTPAAPVGPSQAPRAVAVYQADHPPLLLREFLQRSLRHSALHLAAEAELSALRDLIRRHASSLLPHRFDILGALPPHVSPVEFLDLLPSADPVSGQERIASSSAWFSSSATEASLLDAEDLTGWYTARIRQVDTQAGLVLIQLAYIQHGAAQGVKGLDVIGEDLSLLSKLVYDAGAGEELGSLSRWQTASSEEIVRGYLRKSSPETIVSDVRRLVLPYLYVLESRAERAGLPSAHVVKTHLNDIILTSPLPLQLPLFEASKATLPASQRLIKQDLDVARLALACLYGSSEPDRWPIMSSIFECLPVWEVDASNSDDQEAAATTLESLGAFVRPSASQASPPAATDMYLFFSPLPFASLSRALDILDVHLESGEILAKWGIAYPLRFFVQSAFDAQEQRSCAVRMSRDAGRRISSIGEWDKLLEDMLKLRGGGDGLLRGALGMLSRTEVLKLFLEGLLSSAHFDVASKLTRRSPLSELSTADNEAIVLKVSREFYDNAEQGSLHTGNMKHAYACLEVVSASETIRREKEFIEATSRILSYNIQSSEAGGSVSPLEIRLAHDRLDIIGKVLQSSQGAYRHETVILEIVDKLGYRNNQAAHATVMCKLIALAVQANDSGYAYALCEKLLQTANSTRLRQEQSTKGVKGSKGDETCWTTLVQVAHMPGISNEDRGAHLLAAAVRLCPADELSGLLSDWRKAEKQSKSSLPHWLPVNANSQTSTVHTDVPVGNATTVLGSRRAARAAQMAISFSEHLAGRLPATQLVQEQGPHVSRNAKLALAKGVGWLLGDVDAQRS